MENSVTACVSERLSEFVFYKIKLYLSQLYVFLYTQIMCCNTDSNSPYSGINVTCFLEKTVGI